jgi:hypothetical protein
MVLSKRIGDPFGCESDSNAPIILSRRIKFMNDDVNLIINNGFERNNEVVVINIRRNISRLRVGNVGAVFR